jgi:hypothetical protein
VFNHNNWNVKKSFFFQKIQKRIFWNWFSEIDAFIDNFTLYFLIELFTKPFSVAVLSKINTFIFNFVTFISLLREMLLRGPWWWPSGLIRTIRK